MAEAIRVLQVFHGMDCGGAENMIMNLYRNIDRSKVQFDFLVHTKKKCFFDDEIKELGGRIFTVPYFNIKNTISYKKALNVFFKAHPEITIVHGHLGSCAYIYLNIAKKYGCFTIAHSHNTLPTNKSLKNFMYRIFSFRTRKVADYFMACGKQAGLDRFGKKIVGSDRFQVLNNAIDAQKYIYNPETRTKIRADLGIKDAFVVGHIGRFNYQKNHEYLIDIFYDLLKKEPKARLLLVGDGDLRPQIEAKIKKLGIADKVIMTGVRKDVPDILQAMDCFVFPSHYEGLPVTVIEAQAACLPCVISENITPEVNISGKVQYISIESDPMSWVEMIFRSSGETRDNAMKIIVSNGYDIIKSAKELSFFYLDKGESII